ncbi:MAG: hypothetical protein Q8N41_13730 [Hydrogenophaga sp.]|nr:hypothetical protein [Hydrogenophaga sp.]
MHQMSFAEFASARKPLVLPVVVGEPLGLQAGRCCMDLRLDYLLGDDRGYSLDAVRHIPTGGHSSLVLDTCVYVTAHETRVQ